MNPAYDFPVGLQNVYDKRGNPIEGSRCVVREDTDHVLSIVSDRYGLIHHKTLIDEVVPDIVKNRQKFQPQIYLEKNGRVLNYIINYKSDNYRMRKVGEEVGFQVHIRNSYDAKSAATVKIGALILSCTNGMVSRRSTANLGIRHVNGILEKTNIPAIDKLEESFLLTIEKWDDIGEKPFNSEMIHKAIESLARDQIVAVKKGEDLLSSPPKTYWDFMQFVTAHVTHDRPRLGHDSRIALMGRATSWLEANYNTLAIRN